VGILAQLQARGADAPLTEREIVALAREGGFGWRSDERRLIRGTRSASVLFDGRGRVCAEAVVEAVLALY
jgi:hypothetical protein